jgi:flavin reductase (DIM6/NTAB) family NADH-FMN oxidoreductase RutF
LTIDEALFRQVAGSFATGVTVITTGHPGAYRGMTASAFASLSLEPRLVLVCVDRAAETFGVLEATGAFNVNILTEEQQETSRQFARKASPQAHGLEGVAYHLGAFGLPLLDGCLAYIECRTVHQYDGGDHVIFVGEIMSAALGDGAGPLLYYRSSYGTFGS